MRNVILNLAISLDGFIEGPKGEYDWCLTDQDYGMNSFLNSIDTIIMGRKSYQVMLDNMPEPYPGKKIVVFSNTLETVVPNASIAEEDLLSTMRQLKAAKGKNIWLYGGAALVQDCMTFGLVDELWLAVHPIILGSGKPLFEGLSQSLTLISSKSYDSGLVMLKYKIQ